MKRPADNSSAIHVVPPVLTDQEEAPSEEDKLTITPLGSGNEVGRSCHIVTFKGKTIMVGDEDERTPMNIPLTYAFPSWIAVFIQRIRDWLHCRSLTKSIQPTSISSSFHST